MPITKVGGRYQVVVPKEIREVLNLKPGDYLEVKVMDGAVVDGATSLLHIATVWETSEGLAGGRCGGICAA